MPLRVQLLLLILLTEIRNSSEELRSPSESPHVSHTPGIPGLSGGEPWTPGATVPGLGNSSGTDHVGGPGLADGGQGTVSAFQDQSPEPPPTLSPGTSAASDKETPPPSQEAENNNPDTSGRALDLSHHTDTPGSAAAGQGRDWERAGLGGQAADTAARDLGNVTRPSLTGVPLSPAAADSHTARSGATYLPNTSFSQTVPSTRAELQAERRDNPPDHTDPTRGPYLTGKDPLHPVVLHTEDTPCVTCTSSVTQSLPTRTDSSSSPLPTRLLTSGDGRSGEIHSSSKTEGYISSHKAPPAGTDSNGTGQGVTTREPLSAATQPSTAWLSQGNTLHLLGFTEWTERRTTKPELGVSEKAELRTDTDERQTQGGGVPTDGQQASERTPDSSLTNSGDFRASVSLHSSASLVTRSLSEGEGYNVSVLGISEEGGPILVSTEGLGSGARLSTARDPQTEEGRVSSHSTAPRTASVGDSVSPHVWSWEVETLVPVSTDTEQPSTSETLPQSESHGPSSEQPPSLSAVPVTTEPWAVSWIGKNPTASPSAAQPHISVYPPATETLQPPLDTSAGSESPGGYDVVTALTESASSTERVTDLVTISGSSSPTSLLPTAWDPTENRTPPSHTPSWGGSTPAKETYFSGPPHSTPPAPELHPAGQTTACQGTTAQEPGPESESPQLRREEGGYTSPTRQPGMDTKSTDAYTDTVTTVPTHKSNPSDPDSPRPAVTRLGTSTAATSVTPSVAPSTFHPTPAGGGTVVYSKTGGRTAHSFTTWPTSQTTSSPQALTPSVWGGVVASGATPTSYKTMGPAVDPPTPATPPHGPTSLSPDRRTSRTTTVPGMSTRPSTDRTSRAETRPGLDPTSSRTQRPSTPQGRSSSAPPGQQDRTSAPLRTSLKPRVAGDKSRVFITGDQPPVIKEETLRVPLTIVLETGDQSTQRSLQPEQLQEDTVRQVEPFLQRAPGYHDLQVSTTSGWEVLYCDALFGTGAALLWLGRPGEPLNATGLSEAVRRGLYIAGVRVHNITVSEPQADMCSWLFLCPPGFQCIPSGVGNASCSSLCHMDYCKHSGICTHHHSQQPVCQCPVGEDFWFMGQRCDFRMTRQRMVGIALGALLSVAVVMAMLSFLAYRRFKAMLIQAKVDQTRSSYRRFSRFDDLSGRFWTQSWPGSSVDSLDNPAFSRSDELLHLRALDRTCCYHDDSISLSSTCQGSRTHLNTVYTPSSHYNWGLSNGSINDCMADSGKASDLSVCSWPIEPIQWTPFPLLQQLGIQRAAKTPRPRSYCEGMELVDLERTWTA